MFSRLCCQAQTRTPFAVDFEIVLAPSMQQLTIRTSHSKPYIIKMLYSRTTAEPNRCRARSPERPKSAFRNIVRGDKKINKQTLLSVLYYYHEGIWFVNVVVFVVTSRHLVDTCVRTLPRARRLSWNTQQLWKSIFAWEIYEMYVSSKVVAHLCCHARKITPLAVDFEIVLAPSM